MNLKYSGLSILPTSPPSMAVIVQPGELIFLDRKVEIKEACKVNLRAAGQKQLTKQVYHIRGEGTTSPSFWNGEEMRGSGGAPYQRMVPDSLNVYSKNREIQYIPDQDYVYDYYWGTIKRHPQGKIADGEELSLDYSAWLCRYDALVLLEDGTICVVEGDSETPESRELLLPEPPVVREGFVLAHIFTGWGQACIYGGNSRVLGGAVDAPVLLHGRYEDMVRRTYYVEIAQQLDDGKNYVKLAATGEDYGTNTVITNSTLRWTEPKPFEYGQKLPLVMKTAYENEVDWGLELEIEQLGVEEGTMPIRYEIEAIPEMIFDMKHLLAGFSPLESIPLEQLDHLTQFKQSLLSGLSVRIAFFGESTTRSGLWTYQMLSGLRAKYPDTRIYSSNVAIGGEGTVRGIHRLENEVLNVQPDLIILEYLINDACSGDPEITEKNIRTILERIKDSGAACLIVTNNGMNPFFTPHGAKRNFRFYHEMYRRLAAEYKVAFVGGYAYFDQLHHYGKYFITELKGNMVNHPYGNVDFTWGAFDRVLSDAILKAILQDWK